MFDQSEYWAFKLLRPAGEPRSVPAFTTQFALIFCLITLQHQRWSLIWGA